jgi:tripartite-type tricarboxylate transporter receptor subunit TctC
LSIFVAANIFAEDTIENKLEEIVRRLNDIAALLRASNVVSTLGFSLLFGLVILDPALSQAYPDRQIRIVVPFPPGGGTDIAGRVVASALQERLGKPVIVENRPGGQTIPGSLAVASAPPDGYTLLSCAADQTAINSAFALKLPYDPVKSFTNISGIARASLVLLASKNSEVSSLADLITKAKRSPGKLSFGSLGPSSPHFLLFALFKQLAGIDVVDVPYKGTAQAASDIAGGQIDLTLIGATTANNLASDGRATILGVTSELKNPFAPSAPTFAQSGFPKMTYYSRFGLCGPAGMPRDIVARLDAEVQRAVNAPPASRMLATLGMEPWAASGAEVDDATREMTETFFKVIGAAGIRPEGQ